MNRSRRFDRLLRWYPPQWRDRYRREMVALLEDTFGSRRIPWRVRLSLMRNGSFERARGVGWAGDTTNSHERMKAGSTLIVCCWSLFVVAGAIFAKFSEHWGVATPVVGRHLASLGYDAVQWSGEASVGIVVVAALLVVPSFARYLRGGGWSVIRHSVVRTMSFGLFMAAATTGLAVWAHHLSSPQRNGGLAVYGAAFLLWGVGVVVLIGSSTATMVGATRFLKLPRRVTRTEAGLAMALVLSMVIDAAGVVTWWVAEARYAPSALGGHGAGAFLGMPDVLPPALLVAGMLMVFGLVVASSGVLRVSRAFADQ